MKTTALRLIGLCFAVSLCCCGAERLAAEPRHGIAMHGEPKYPAGFAHFDYVNPQAPKGGRVVLGALGAFDSLNPFTSKGNPAPGMREYVYESLLARADDEPFSLYGLLAESVEVPDDRGWVLFTLRPEARFADGKPVTVDDVIFSLELLRDKGILNTHRAYYSKVERIERVGERGVKMFFRPDGDREMPLIIGVMPVFPKHLVDPDTFEQHDLHASRTVAALTTVGEVVPGSRVTFKRNPGLLGARSAGQSRSL